MAKIRYIIIVIVLVCMSATSQDSKLNEGDVLAKTSRAERLLLRKGAKAYQDKRYSDAVTELTKALEVSPSSQVAKYNLATALLKQVKPGKVDTSDPQNPLLRATEFLQDVASDIQNKALSSKAAFDLGNIAYNTEQYEQAISLYKQALRLNPNDVQARYNLRMTQLKNRKNQTKQKDRQDQPKPQPQPQNQKKQQSDLSEQSAEQILNAATNAEQQAMGKMDRVNARLNKTQQKIGW